MSMRFVRFSAVCLLFAACASAQLATTTSLVGTITDSSGKVDPERDSHRGGDRHAGQVHRYDERQGILFLGLRPRRHLQHHREGPVFKR